LKIFFIIAILRDFRLSEQVSRSLLFYLAHLSSIIHAEKKFPQ